METLSNLQKVIASIDWFSALGKPVQESPSVTVISDFSEGLRHWKDNRFSEARSIAWEAFRCVVLQDEELQKQWIYGFEALNQHVRDSISRSKKAILFIDCTETSVDDFCRDLPFVGAFGEILIKDKFPNYNFFSSQLKYYYSGHWVCGWRGDLNSTSFQYPSPNFFIL